MKVFYSDYFVLPLPAGHRFPMVKYSMLHERVEAAEMRRVGFPWSERMVERSRRASGGTLGACLAERDRLVLESCRERRTPVAVTMAGGYATNIEDRVEIHSIERAAKLVAPEKRSRNGRAAWKP